MKIAKKIRVITAAVSVISVVSLLIVFIFVMPSMFDQWQNEILVSVILITIVPIAILDFINQRWADAIDDQLPTLVRGISESQETGLTLARALETVVKTRAVSGPLGEEVRKISVQMSWGSSFEKALENFVKRIGTPAVERFCALVLQASYSGGNIQKVFSTMSGYMEDMRAMNKEASSDMKPYTIIIYAAFFVFLFTSLVLLTSFFAPLEGYSAISGVSTGITVGQYEEFFYQTILISAILGGLMAGKIGERRILGGLKHAIIMVIIGYIAYLVIAG